MKTFVLLALGLAVVSALTPPRPPLSMKITCVSTGVITVRTMSVGIRPWTNAPDAPGYPRVSSLIILKINFRYSWIFCTKINYFTSKTSSSIFLKIGHFFTLDNSLLQSPLTGGPYHCLYRHPTSARPNKIRPMETAIETIFAEAILDSKDNHNVPRYGPIPNHKRQAIMLDAVRALHFSLTHSVIWEGYYDDTKK